MHAIVASLIFCAYIIAVQCLWVKEMENKGLWEGDIVLDPDEKEHAKNGTRLYASIKGGRWPKGKIPYVIQNTIGSQGVQAINDAIENYHKYTCLRFHKRTNEASYINFFRGSGCSSPVGYRPGRVNSISLAMGCWRAGIVMHEIGHTMGFYHEQGRPDRDDYIEIIWKNIESGMAYNFQKQSTEIIDSLGTPYDYDSMMHYGRSAFAIRWGETTIVTKDPSKQWLIGQRDGFSEVDKRQLGLMYNKICEAPPPPPTPSPPPTSPRPSVPIPPGCYNKNRKCEQWAKMGECWRSIDFMKKTCCKACKEFGCVGPCVDRNINCKSWAKKDGYCKGPWMLCNCCKSCKNK